MSQTLSQLGIQSQENVFIENANLGSLSFHLESGRLLFNGGLLQTGAKLP